MMNSMMKSMNQHSPLCALLLAVRDLDIAAATGPRQSISLGSGAAWVAARATRGSFSASWWSRVASMVDDDG